MRALALRVGLQETLVRARERLAGAGRARHDGPRVATGGRGAERAAGRRRARRVVAADGAAGGAVLEEVRVGEDGAVDGARGVRHERRVEALVRRDDVGPLDLAAAAADDGRLVAQHEQAARQARRVERQQRRGVARGRRVLEQHGAARRQRARQRRVRGRHDVGAGVARCRRRRRVEDAERRGRRQHTRGEAVDHRDRHRAVGDEGREVLVLKRRQREGGRGRRWKGQEREAGRLRASSAHCDGGGRDKRLRTHLVAFRHLDARARPRRRARIGDDLRAARQRRSALG